jgi:hypothetical protein
MLESRRVQRDRINGNNLIQKLSHSSDRCVIVKHHNAIVACFAKTLFELTQ